MNAIGQLTLKCSFWKNLADLQLLLMEHLMAKCVPFKAKFVKFSANLLSEDSNTIKNLSERKTFFGSKGKN